MFERYFTAMSVLAHHECGAFSKERKAYLRAREKDGYTIATLGYIARFLLWSAEKLQAEIYRGKPIPYNRVKEIGDQWFRKSRCRNPKRYRRRHLNLFVQEVSGWFRSLGILEEPTKARTPFSKFLEEMTLHLEKDRGFSSCTIQNRCKHVSGFLKWYLPVGRSFRHVKITHVDSYLKLKSENGYCRRSIAALTSELRGFFRFAEKKGWCREKISNAIESPKLYREETIPAGPSWKDVKRLLAVAKTKKPRDIRDFPILMLFATYGLRASEVAELRLDNIDWKRKQIRIIHAKNNRTQIFPLLPSVGNAILRYLRLVRPKSDFREVFLKLTPPFGPIGRGSLNHVVKSRMLVLGIHCLHRGPHALRHACATHLLAEGHSLKEVGDHLGHRRLSSTQVYAKVDLNQLRTVADFNFGDVL